MTSQTVTGLGLQYTDDNKYSYGYSGVIAFNNTASTLLEFKTQSEYNIVDMLYMRHDSDSLDSKHKVYFNDILVISLPLSSGGQDRQSVTSFVIPPFTSVKIDIENVSNTSSGSGMVALTGKIGMAPRVGN